MRLTQLSQWKQWAGRQWLAIILLLSLIPIVFFGTILYWTGTKIVEAEVERSSQHSIVQMKDQMDLLTFQIEQFSNQFSLQTNVTELLNIGATPSIGSLPLTTSVVNDLSMFAYLLKSIDSAYLYHVAQNTVIYQEGVTTFGSSSFPDTGWLDTVNKAAAAGSKSFWIAPRTMNNNVGQTGKTLSYVRILPYMNNEMKAVLVINVKESYLLELLKNFPLGEGEGLFIFNENNQLITATDTNITLQPVELANITRLWTNSNYASATSRMQQPDAFVTYSHSDKNNWTYALLVPANMPVKSVQTLKQIIIMTTIVLSLLALITSYFSFQRIQNGVRQILYRLNRSVGDIHAEEGAVSPSVEMKIEQIEQRIKKLMEENYDYKQKHLEQNAVMRNSYLQALLQGQIRGGSAQNPELAPQLPSSFTHPHYSVFLIEMDAVESKSFHENDEPLFLYAAANIAKELLSEMTAIETVLIPKQAVAILNIPETLLERNLQEAAETLRQTILKILKHSVTISVGRIAHTLDELPDTFMEATLTLQRHWLGDGNEVILPGGTIRAEAAIAHYPAVWEDRLFRYIRSGDKQGAREALQHFNDDLKAQHIPFSQLKTFCLQLLVSAIRIFGNEHDVLDGRKLYDEFMRLSNWDEMSEWMFGILADSLPQMIEKLNKRQKEDIEGKMFKIIESRYAQDLSLQMIADECGVSTSYLSELFKNRVGITYIQYVTNYRVDKVKHLLLNTELNMAQIAEAVGYSNAPQLIRVFKKAIGTTPGEFRTNQKSLSG
ncbi:helix-turn-helix domain-containing protein [Paenibacillus aceris]|uniref:AraC-like DNA-binding protein n=1 Tax=Paenibacillus aceris TaxID=869555 RepID=A0ABS4I1Y6_9BACL|nr:helix-turn-helix domain-containing protein [Paenibacillus aceris]MBP1964915.1 AraC-like DNA-binding protein [Paenibacillus aceris]NHW38161.1 AraC family transcriptional regulator [Paenibacillus aceris]